MNDTWTTTVCQLIISDQFLLHHHLQLLIHPLIYIYMLSPLPLFSLLLPCPFLSSPLLCFSPSYSVVLPTSLLLVIPSLQVNPFFPTPADISNCHLSYSGTCSVDRKPQL
ncbi:hypothetical protein V8C37DRAFT_259992 [Trichoderma ceciliae]